MSDALGVDAGARLDPEIAAVLVPFLEATGGFTIGPDTLELVRSRSLVPPVELSDGVERTDHTVPGDVPVVVRVHRPKGVEGPLPCVYSIHGGGYVIGSYEDDDARFDAWSRTFPCVGVSVEYRLAPETPYPGPLEDCYAGLRWTFEHAAELGIDPARIGIAGYSAGGGLAAALALLARDRGEVDVAFQLLVYPMVDDRRHTTTSGWDVPIWNPAANEFGWRSYLGDLFGADDVPAYAAPARAADLSGLPPSYVMVGALDLFCDEDLDYAQRLNHAGVDVELHLYPGAPHGFDGLLAAAAVSARARRDIEHWLHRQLHP